LLETRKFQSSRGFTIMEVALAATVLALTLVGMIGVVETGTQMLDLSRKQTIAAQILHGEIDHLRLESWPTIAGYSASGTTAIGNGYAAGPTSLTSANDPVFATFVAEYPNANKIFTLTRTVSCVMPVQSNNNPSPYSTNPYLILVSFTITWKGVTGRGYSRVSSTYVGFNGLYQSSQRS
jgi:Tfp pilus assembly protein PilV